MTTEEDFKLLAGNEDHHHALKRVSSEWITNSGLEILAEREGVAARTAIAIKHDVCPIDTAATARIKFWVSALEEGEENLAPFIAKALIRAIDWCIANDDAKLWGLVPHAAPHLIRFLRVPAGLGLIDEVATPLKKDVRDQGSYGEIGVFFITDQRRYDDCKRFLQGI